jgi:hypothetical protein
MRNILIASLITILAVGLAYAQTEDGRYDIMRPEPRLQPKYKSPRGSTEHVVIPRPSSVPQPQTIVPPPLYVPQTGRVLPNLPSVSGSGLGGAETSQDRAIRCAHQAGAYGQAAGNANAYVGSCINQ